MLQFCNFEENCETKLVRDRSPTACASSCYLEMEMWINAPVISLESVASS